MKITLLSGNVFENVFISAILKSIIIRILDKDLDEYSSIHLRHCSKWLQFCLAVTRIQRTHLKGAISIPTLGSLAMELKLGMNCAGMKCAGKNCAE